MKKKTVRWHWRCYLDNCCKAKPASLPRTQHSPHLTALMWLSGEAGAGEGRVYWAPHGCSTRSPLHPSALQALPGQWQRLRHRCLPGRQPGLKAGRPGEASGAWGGLPQGSGSHRLQRGGNRHRHFAEHCCWEGTARQGLQHATLLQPPYFVVGSFWSKQSVLCTHHMRKHPCSTKELHSVSSSDFPNTSYS